MTLLEAAHDFLFLGFSVEKEKKRVITELLLLSFRVFRFGYRKGEDKNVITERDCHA